MKHHTVKGKKMDIILTLAAACMLWLMFVSLYSCAEYPVRFNHIESTE